MAACVERWAPVPREGCRGNRHIHMIRIEVTDTRKAQQGLRKATQNPLRAVLNISRSMRCDTGLVGLSFTCPKRFTILGAAGAFTHDANSRLSLCGQEAQSVT
eukprot:28489-Eustigmatos_ZCMA.PRE.1